MRVEEAERACARRYSGYGRLLQGRLEQMGECAPCRTPPTARPRHGRPPRSSMAAAVVALCALLLVGESRYRSCIAHAEAELPGDAGVRVTGRATGPLKVSFVESTRVRSGTAAASSDAAPLWADLRRCHARRHCAPARSSGRRSGTGAQPGTEPTGTNGYISEPDQRSGGSRGDGPTHGRSSNTSQIRHDTGSIPDGADRPSAGARSDSRPGRHGPRLCHGAASRRPRRRRRRGTQARGPSGRGRW